MFSTNLRTDNSDMYSHIVIFVDLDGTITSSRINNTYHFTMAYYKINRHTIGLLFFLFLLNITKILTNLFALFGFDLDWNVIFISVLFWGHNINKLKYFSYIWFKSLLRLNFINLKLLEKLNYFKRRGAKVIMLTSCPELPACIIAKLLRFDACFARRFATKSNRVIALLDKESASMLKLKYLLQIKYFEKKTNIYILDKMSTQAEGKILKFFDKVILVETIGDIFIL